MTESVTCWLSSLPINTFLESFDAAKDTWKMRFVFTSMGPNIRVNDRWKPTLPKMQIVPTGLEICAKTVANARYIPTRITRIICNPDPLITRRSFLLMIIAVRITVMQNAKQDKAASVAPCKLSSVRNVWEILTHSNCFSLAGHCLSGHTSHVSLSTRNSLFRQE